MTNRFSVRPVRARWAAYCFVGLAAITAAPACSSDDAASTTTTSLVTPTTEEGFDTTTTTSEVVGPVDCAALKPASEALSAGKSADLATDLATVRAQNPPKVVVSFLDGAEGNPASLVVNPESGAPTPLSEWTGSVCP